MQRIIGRIEVDPGLARWSLVRFEKHTDQQPIQRFRISRDVFITIRRCQRRGTELQPV